MSEVIPSSAGCTFRRGLLLAGGGLALAGGVAWLGFRAVEPTRPPVPLPLERRVVEIGGEGFGFLRVPAGCFSMGSRFGETHRDRDESRHEVCVEGFWLGEKEIRNAQYRKFRPEHDSGRQRDFTLNDPMQPVAGISWVEGQEFLAWMGKESGGRFRYPTEAEWEYAARGGIPRARFWGDDPALACGFANGHDAASAEVFAGFTWEAHPCRDGHGVSAPVGSFAPNPWGFYDLLGNVWEWTCSGYDRNYADGLETQCGDDREHSGYRVVRGGSWVNQPSRVRSATRKVVSLNARFRSVGLRAVLE